MDQIAVTELFEMGCAKEVGRVESLMISKENTGFARKLLQSPGNNFLSHFHLFLAKAKTF